MTLLQEIRHPRLPVTYSLMFAEMRSPFSRVTLPSYCVVSRRDGSTAQQVTPFPSLDTAEGYLSACLNSRRV